MSSRAKFTNFEVIPQFPDTGETVMIASAFGPDQRDRITNCPLYCVEEDGHSLPGDIALQISLDDMSFSYTPSEV